MRIFPAHTPQGMHGSGICIGRNQAPAERNLLPSQYSCFLRRRKRQNEPHPSHLKKIFNDVHICGLHNSSSTDLFHTTKLFQFHRSTGLLTYLRMSNQSVLFCYLTGVITQFVYVPRTQFELHSLRTESFERQHGKVTGTSFDTWSTDVNLVFGIQEQRG